MERSQHWVKYSQKLFLILLLLEYLPISSTLLFREEIHEDKRDDKVDIESQKVKNILNPEPSPKSNIN